MPLLARGPSPGAAAGLGQDVLQFHAGPPGIGFGHQCQLFGDDFADVEHISNQRLGGVGLGIEDRLTAFRIKLFGQILLEHDAESIVEDLGHWLQAQDARLNDLPSQTALDHDLTADRQIDGHAGSEARQAQKIKPLGECRAFTLASDNIQRRAGAPHSIQIDDAFYF